MSVGASTARFDALAKTSGQAEYPADRVPADALIAKVVFSGQAHARMTGLDTTAASAVPGVVAVITAADVPVNEYGLTKFDQPVLIGPSNAPSVSVETNVSRWEADKIAVIVAETADAAEAGSAALMVEWQPLPLVPDIDSARSDALLVHPEDETNTYYHLRIRRGDIELGWQQATVVVEGTYRLPYQEHAYLQPEAATAWIDEAGRVAVEVAGQWAHEDQAQIAHSLDLDPSDVRVIWNGSPSPASQISVS